MMTSRGYAVHKREDSPSSTSPPNHKSPSPWASTRGARVPVGNPSHRRRSVPHGTQTRASTGFEYRAREVRHPDPVKEPSARRTGGTPDALSSHRTSCSRSTLTVVDVEARASISREVT